MNLTEVLKIIFSKDRYKSLRKRVSIKNLSKKYLQFNFDVYPGWEV